MVQVKYAEGIFKLNHLRSFADLPLVSSMPVSILALFVIVIDRARAGARTGAYQCTLPAANQRPRAGTNGCADPDAFRGLLFSGFRIAMTPALAASDGNCEREREHQQ
jgi:hypothetical protein